MASVTHPIFCINYIIMSLIVYSLSMTSSIGNILVFCTSFNKSHRLFHLQDPLASFLIYIYHRVFVLHPSGCMDFLLMWFGNMHWGGEFADSVSPNYKYLHPSSRATGVEQDIQ